MITLFIPIREINAVLFARVFLGLLFFLQGYDKIFRMKISKVIEEIHAPLAERGVPEFFSAFGAYLTSFIELIAGSTLIIGFATYWSLYLLGFDMLFAALAFGLVQPMWDMKHIFPRMALLIFLLLAPSQWDVVSVDYMWSLIKFIRSL
jgi:putative oxidoreductase